MVCIDQPRPFQGIEEVPPFPSQDLEPSFLERFDLRNLDTVCEATPRYNVAPTQPVLAIRQSDEGKRALVPLRWGLVPSWSKGPDSRYSMINARAETVKSKPAYRNGFKHRRCLIPAERHRRFCALATITPTSTATSVPTTGTPSAGTGSGRNSTNPNRTNTTTIPRRA
jgi:hypothetical protein